MLKTRILTALVLAPLFLWAILAWSTTALAVLFAVVVALGAWEWSRLIGLVRPLAQGGYIASVVLLLGVAWWYLATRQPLLPVFAVSGIWWLGALIWLARYSAGKSAGLAAVPGILVGYLLLIPTWLGLVWLHADGGAYWLILLMLLVWGADVGAYFTGRRLGKRKLAPKVSPGKTWEGVAGGAVTALAAVLLLHAIAGQAALPLLVLAPIALATAMFSVVGDLFESMAKRQRGMKDSSQLLPGHGGVLDRVDSLTAAAPLFSLGLLWWRGLL